MEQELSLSQALIKVLRSAETRCPGRLIQTDSDGGTRTRWTSQLHLPLCFCHHARPNLQSLNELPVSWHLLYLPSLHSAPFIKLRFLITSLNWKSGSHVTVAHCYISLPLFTIRKETVNWETQEREEGWIGSYCKVPRCGEIVMGLFIPVSVCVCVCVGLLSLWLIR